MWYRPLGQFGVSANNAGAHRGRQTGVKDLEEEDFAACAWSCRVGGFNIYCVFLLVLRTHAFSHVEVS